jgi:peptide/nickel transport system permease protein
VRSPLLRFAARRLAWAALTAWTASLLAFVLFWAVPNLSPEWSIGGKERSTERTRAQAAAEHDLDKPLPAQYWRLVRGVATGDVPCYESCGDMRRAVIDGLGVTLSVVAGAALLAVGLGVWLALICVRHAGRWLDRAILRLAAVMYSVPSLVLAVLLWTYLCSRNSVFPYQGYVGLTDDPPQWAFHLVLPWVAAALPFAGAYVQILRASLLEARGEDWVRAARAKGLSERAVVRRHVLRNALAPGLSIAGLDFSHAFGGFVLYVEVVFGLPGIGALTEQTLTGLDLPPVFALTVWLALVVVVTSAVVDILVAALDPRVAL